MRELVVLNVKSASLLYHHDSTLSITRTDDTGLEMARVIIIYKDTIVSKLFLNQNNFLETSHDKVSARIERTFLHRSELLITLTRKHTFLTSEHDWNTAQ